MIDRATLARAGELPCRCGACRLPMVVVDRYATDYPPIPWVDLVEFYIASGGDPDDRITECPRCWAELDLSTINPDTKETIT